MNKWLLFFFSFLCTRLFISLDSSLIIMGVITSCLLSLSQMSRFIRTHVRHIFLDLFEAFEKSMGTDHSACSYMAIEYSHWKNMLVSTKLIKLKPFGMSLGIVDAKGAKVIRDSFVIDWLISPYTIITITNLTSKLRWYKIKQVLIDTH